MSNGRLQRIGHADLRKRESFLSRILEACVQGIMVFDMQGRISYANSSAEQMLGLTRTEMGHLTYMDPGWRLTTVDGDPVQRQDLPVGPVMQGKRVTGLQYGLERGDGSRAVLSVSLTPLRDPFGAVTGLVASLADISPVRRAE